MFKKTKQILKNLFIKSHEIQITSSSQPHVLAHRMNSANIEHDQTVLADIQNVRVIRGKLEEEDPSNITSLFFCPVEAVVVKEILSPGDGQYIATQQISLKGIKAPKHVLGRQGGLYNLTDILLHANGTITIKATPETKWVKV